MTTLSLLSINLEFGGELTKNGILYKQNSKYYNTFINQYINYLIDSFNYIFDVKPTEDTTEIIAHKNANLNEFDIIGVGKNTITITREESSHYKLVSTDIILEVIKSEPTFNLEPIDKIFSVESFEVRIPDSLDDLANNEYFVYSYEIQDNTIATISNNFVSLLKSGTTKINITRDSTEYYESKTIQIDLNVTHAPGSFNFMYNGSNNINKQ